MSYTADMRYNTDLISPYHILLGNDIKGNRPLVFARDLVYYVIHKYQKNWRPVLNKTYTIHQMSPLTPSVRLAVDIALRKMDHVYTFNYYELIEPSRPDGLAKFIGVARSAFDRFRKLEKKSINVLFDILVFVARLGVECKLRRVPDAPHLAVVLINLFLIPLDKEVFALFHQHALDTIAVRNDLRPGEVPMKSLIPFNV